MKFLVTLAVRNLFRQRRRTFITAVAIAVGLSMFIFFDSMLTGLRVDSEQNLILYETGSARITTEAFWEDRENLPLKESIEQPGRLLQELEEAGYAATPRIVFSGELILRKDPFPEDGSMQAKISAIDPERDGEVYEIVESLSDGRMLKRDEPAVLLGQWLAEDINAEVGYPLTIVTRTKQGYFQTIDVEIVGLVSTPNPQVNRTGIFLPLETADYFLQMEGAVSQIDIHFAFHRSLKREMASIREVVDPESSTGAGSGAGPPSDAGSGARSDAGGEQLTLVSWREIGEDFVALAAAKDSGSKMILFLVFIIAAVGVSNTMLMSVYERIREIGMMRALGMKGGEIRWAFLLEAAGIGLIGSAVGLLIGAAANVYLVEYGIDYSFMMRDLDMGYRITGIMRGIWDSATFVSAFLTGVLLSVLIALIPTRKALKMSVTDALRYQ